MPYIILGVLLHHAPDGAAQARTVQVYHQQYLNVIAAHEVNQDLEYEKVLVSMLYEGLHHGVWPWHHGKYGTGTTEEAVAAIPHGSMTWGPWGSQGRQGV